MEPFHIDVHRLVNLQQRDCSGLAPDSLLMSCVITARQPTRLFTYISARRQVLPQENGAKVLHLGDTGK